MAWLTTAGHTMNFREMGIGQGWVPAPSVYSLHTIYRRFRRPVPPGMPGPGSARLLPQPDPHSVFRCLAASLVSAMASSSMRPTCGLLAGRVPWPASSVGLVIYFAPRLLDRRWENPTTWAAIVLPVTGPAGDLGRQHAIHAPSAWEWGFLVEGARGPARPGRAARPWRRMPELAPPAPQGSLAFLPFLVLGSAALVYCLHWGQLHGWLESDDIAVAAALGALSLALAFLLVYPRPRLPGLERGLDSPAPVLLRRRMPVLPRDLDEYLRRALAQLQHLAAVLVDLVVAPGRRDQSG